MLFAKLVERYVVALGGSYPVDEYGIRSDSAFWTSSAATRRVATLGERQSFALLGEPGIGKSTTIGHLVGDHPAVTYIRLDEASDVHVLQDLLAPAVVSPVAQPATLVLDGVDECPLAPKTMVRHVVAALTGRPDIRVVVGCRTADWPASLEVGLRATLGAFDVLELLPLSMEDILTLANSRGVDGEGFLAALRGAAAGPLATLPLTLDLLLNLYVEQGALPADPRQLYERGLLLLATDPDRDRAVERTPAGTDAQRLATSARIAAVLMLCGRSAVAVHGLFGDTDVPAGELSAGTEPLSTGDFAVTAELVRGALWTALFSGRGPGRLGISHASFGAYLTARYLHAHQVPEHQLRALLTRMGSLGRTSVPTRLRETAAWLLALDPERGRWLVDLDPDALVAHGALLADEGVRALLVAHLLDDNDLNAPGERHRWPLAHPGIADQLRPALRAPLTEDAGPHFGHPVSRRAHTAIQIARRSGTREVAPEIADLVASSELNPYLQSVAAHGLADLDHDRAVAVLRHLLDEVVEHPDRDPHDDLRGVALTTCWPTALTVTELLSALKGPQDQSYIGSYQMFLHNFVDELSEDDVEQLVRGVATPGHTVEDAPSDEQGWYDEDEVGHAAFLLTGSRRGARLMTGLLERALRSTRLDSFIDAAGSLVAECVKHHERSALPMRFARDDGDEQTNALRRALVLAALKHMPPSRAPQLAWNWKLPDVDANDPSAQRRHGLVGLDDLPWLFTLIDGPYTDHAPGLIRAIFDPFNQLHQEVAWEHRGHPVFAASIGHWFEPVDLSGAVAEQMREVHELSNPRPTWPGHESHVEALADAWSRCKSGDATAFGEVCRRLRTDPQTGFADLFDDDVTNWPSFYLLEAEPDELAAAARSYLTAADPSIGDWLLKAGSITYMAVDGYAGLSLLARRPDAQAWFDGLPDEVWARWAPAVVRSPTTPDDESGAVRDKLLAELAHRVPAHFADAYTSWVEQVMAAGWSLPDLRPLASAYVPQIDDRLSLLLTPLIETITTTRSELDLLPPASDENTAADAKRTELSARLSVAMRDATNLGEFLCSRGHQATITMLETVLGTTDSPGPVVAEARTAAAGALVSSRAIAWGTVIRLMQADVGFGRSAAYEFARSLDGGFPLRDLGEEELGELWTWLNDGWGRDTDEISSGFVFVSDDEHVRRWRDAVVRELAGRATPTALSTLATLLEAHPGDESLRGSLREAEIRERDESWQGPTLQDLSALVADARRTLVHDDDDLYRLVMSVLERFATRLEGVGQLLWNESRSADDAARTVWRPKYESDVSAFLKDHLEQEFADQLVVNREVLVRQTTSRGHGLSVDVLASGGSEQATYALPQCPIEVKGSWNPGLLTDLQTQLVDDYLPALRASRGVYVCAWFSVEQWDDVRDSRRATAARRDRLTIAQELEEAAARASAGGLGVAAVVIDVPRPSPSARTQASD